MGENIRISLEAARVNATLTIKQASENLGVSEQTLINWEKGRTEPTISQARSLSELYKMPLDYISMPIKSNLI